MQNNSFSKIARCLFVGAVAAVTFLDFSVSAQNCYTPDKAVGKCVPINYCPPLWEIFQDRGRNEIQTQLLINSQCDYLESIPYVCCPLLDQNNGGCIFGTCMELAYCPSVLLKLHENYGFGREGQQYLQSVSCNSKTGFGVCCRENIYGHTLTPPNYYQPPYYPNPEIDGGYYTIYPNGVNNNPVVFPPVVINNGETKPVDPTISTGATDTTYPTKPTESTDESSKPIITNPIIVPPIINRPINPPPVIPPPVIPPPIIKPPPTHKPPIVVPPMIPPPMIKPPPIYRPPIIVPPVQLPPNNPSLSQFAPPYNNVDPSVVERLLPRPGKCGVSAAEDKIVGGNDTGLNDYPWMGLIEYDTRKGELRVACGSALITSRYVLTAGHCLTPSVVQRIGTPLHVRLGEYDRRHTIDCLPLFRGKQECNERPLRIPIESMIIHPNYNESAGNHRNDIALIRLKHEAPYTDFIRPICLPMYDISQRPGGPFYLTVAGWGANERGGSSNRKLHVHLPLVNIDKCQNYYLKNGLRAALWTHQMCAGGELGKDSCRGDSGGPLMMAEFGSVYQLHGIVSFGPTPCARANIPGVYTKVAAYVPWILGTIKD